MKVATLGLITDSWSLLLGEKKKGEIGTGVLSGPGGKLEPDESLAECLIRETKEEWGITLHKKKLERIAQVTFYVAGVPDFDVHVFHVKGFSGELQETADTKKPEWYPLDELPFERMYDGDRFWLPKVIMQKNVRAHVYYRDRAKNFERVTYGVFE